MNTRLGHGDGDVRAGGPSDLADGEREAVGRSHGAGDDDHLVCLESSTHTPYVAHHCRRNMVDSLPRGMPKVVDYRQIDAQAPKQDGDARQTRGFIQVRPPRRHNTYVLRLIVLQYVNERCFLGGSPAALYSLGGRVIDLETNPSQLQLP